MKICCRFLYILTFKQSDYVLPHVQMASLFHLTHPASHFIISYISSCKRAYLPVLLALPQKLRSGSSPRWASSLWTELKSTSSWSRFISTVQKARLLSLAWQRLNKKNPRVARTRMQTMPIIIPTVWAEKELPFIKSFRSDVLVQFFLAMASPTQPSLQRSQ